MVTTPESLALHWEPFRCDVEPRRDVARVVGAGELDVATCGQVADRLRELRDVGFSRLELDLRAVTFLDSAAVHVILEADRAARDGGGELALILGPPAVERTLEVCGVVDRLTFREP